MSRKDPVRIGAAEKTVFGNVVAATLGDPEINLLMVENGIVYCRAGGKTTVYPNDGAGASGIKIDPMRLQGCEITGVAGERGIEVCKDPDANRIPVDRGSEAVHHVRFPSGSAVGNRDLREGSELADAEGQT